MKLPHILTIAIIAPVEGRIDGLARPPWSWSCIILIVTPVIFVWLRGMDLAPPTHGASAGLTKC